MLTVEQVRDSGKSVPHLSEDPYPVLVPMTHITDSFTPSSLKPLLYLSVLPSQKRW